ncbi:MAG: AbrB/MazE/SpoVT family DNA-binding domain-containing protein [Nitrososphaerales archaeon]
MTEIFANLIQRVERIPGILILMVENKGEKTIEVDRQGRIVLPSRLRERLGLKGGGSVSIRLEGSSKIIMEPKTSRNIEESVENWVKLALTAKTQVLSERSRKAGRQKPMMGSKWMSSTYARRKLGFPTV